MDSRFVEFVFDMEADNPNAFAVDSVAFLRDDSIACLACCSPYFEDTWLNALFIVALRSYTDLSIAFYYMRVSDTFEFMIRIF